MKFKLDDEIGLRAVSRLVAAVDYFPEEIVQVDGQSTWLGIDAILGACAPLKHEVDNAELLEVEPALYHVLTSDLRIEFSLCQEKLDMVFFRTSSRHLCIF